MNGLWGAFLEILYPMPMRCVCCGEGELAGEGILCPDCLDALRSGAPDRMVSAEAFSISIAAHPYAGSAGALVRALKYRGITALSKQMGDEICEALKLYGVAPPDRVTFVPMHRARRMASLFNQSERIARAVGANMNLRTECLLKRVRRCRQQASMTSVEARLKNVQDAFRAVGPLDGARVLLVDDVYTTGATAGECARALRVAGAREVVVAVYARGGGNVR